MISAIAIETESIFNLLLPFNKCLLNVYYMATTILGPGMQQVITQGPYSWGLMSPVKADIYTKIFTNVFI